MSAPCEAHEQLRQALAEQTTQDGDYSVRSSAAVLDLVAKISKHHKEAAAAAQGLQGSGSTEACGAAAPPPPP